MKIVMITYQHDVAMTIIAPATGWLPLTDTAGGIAKTPWGGDGKTFPAGHSIERADLRLYRDLRPAKASIRALEITIEERHVHNVIPVSPHLLSAVVLRSGEEMRAYLLAEGGRPVIERLTP